MYALIFSVSQGSQAHRPCDFRLRMLGLVFPDSCALWTTATIWVVWLRASPGASVPLQAAPLLIHVSSFAATSHKKKLYVIGGGPNGKLATDKTQCYDPSTNKWNLKSAMPVEAKCINAVSFRDRIYVVGKWANGMMWVGLKRKRRWDWSRPWWNLSFSPGDRNSPHLGDRQSR